MFPPARFALAATFIALFLATAGAALPLAGGTHADAAPAGSLRARLDIGSLDEQVFTLAERALTCAVRKGVVQNPRTLTVIDYSQPSTAERLWVFDLEAEALVYEELVAHGQGSGHNLPTLFSNEPGSHKTSLGLFVAEETYVGSNGYSVRLTGLEPGFNDRARERAIVMHGAPYVSDTVAKALGRLGRSWGCPAVRAEIARALIDRVKGGGLVFSYYPDPGWLTSSSFLSDCGTGSEA